jgi:hypothetical protein
MQAGQTMGSFIIDTQEVYFGDGAGMIAMQLAGRSHLTLQCFSKTGKFLVRVGDYNPGVGHTEELSIEVFADGKPVVQTKGVTPPEGDYERAVRRNGWAVAIGWTASLENSEPVIDSISNAKNISFHITRNNGQSFDLSFSLSEPATVVGLLKKKGCRKPLPDRELRNLPEAGNWMFGIASFPAGYEAGSLYLINRANFIELYCMKNHNWKLFVNKREVGEHADYTNPVIAYAIDDGKEVQISGDIGFGGDRMDFREEDAKKLVSDLLTAQHKFSFSVGIKRAMSVIDFSTGLIHDDLNQLLESCPLTPL